MKIVLFYTKLDPGIIAQVAQKTPQVRRFVTDYASLRVF